VACGIASSLLLSRSTVQTGGQAVRGQRGEPSATSSASERPSNGFCNAITSLPFSGEHDRWWQCPQWVESRHRSNQADVECLGAIDLADRLRYFDEKVVRSGEKRKINHV